MKRIILAALLGGIVLFVWGSVSWMVLPWHDATMKPLAQEGETLALLAEQVEGSGVHFFPAWPEHPEDEGAMAAFRTAHQEGPVGMLVVRIPGGPVMPPSTFARGLLLNVLAAGLMAFLLSCATGRCTTWGARLLFVVLTALLIGLTADAMNWNWMHFPTDYTVVMVLDRLAGWTLGGLVLAGVIRD